jgi:hypothetical protein
MVALHGMGNGGRGTSRAAARAFAALFFRNRRLDGEPSSGSADTHLNRSRFVGGDVAAHDLAKKISETLLSRVNPDTPPDRGVTDGLFVIVKEIERVERLRRTPGFFDDEVRGMQTAVGGCGACKEAKSSMSADSGGRCIRLHLHLVFGAETPRISQNRDCPVNV